MNWYIGVLKKYLVFQGRARRKEYWMFTLFHVIIFLVLGFIDQAAGLGGEAGYGVLSGLYALATLLPGLAVTIRRLHDTSRSGWWILIGFIPLLGGLVVLVFMCLDSTPGTNQYGPNPKGVEA